MNCSRYDIRDRTLLHARTIGRERRRVVEIVAPTSHPRAAASKLFAQVRAVCPLEIRLNPPKSGQARPDGTKVQKELRRLLPLKTKAEYEPDDVAPGVAIKAVERAQRCVAVARVVAACSL